MSLTSPTKVIFFDLDNTLFDHYHSMRSAVSSMQNDYPRLAEIEVGQLLVKYNMALQRAYDEYLDKKITYQESDVKKIQLFFTDIGLPEPTLKEVKEFRDKYKSVYRKIRRATPGSIETLVRIREHGYRIAIITNGQTADQAAKIEAIGISHLIDTIITSEEIGYRKPDVRIFNHAIETFGAPLHTTYMVGDSADADIKGAIDAKLGAILYSPTARDSQRLLSRQTVPIISHMSQLLAHLGIETSEFCPRLPCKTGQ